MTIFIFKVHSFIRDGGNDIPLVARPRHYSRPRRASNAAAFVLGGFSVKVNPMDELNDDREILDLISARKDEGFDRLVETYGPMLYRYARRMCGDEADDVLQETFLTAREKISQFRGEGKLRNWLFRIAGNACRQRWRQQQSRGGPELRLEDVLPDHEELVNLDPQPWQLDPAQKMLSAELMQKLEAAIAQIPPTNRSVLLLRDLEGLSTRETAHALDITEETVKVRLHRARAYVRRLLADYFKNNR
jgi:RNA polymerase sigma-70 factor, ECF subfamily